MTVAAIIRGPLGRRKRSRLAIDTGSAMSFVSTDLATALDLTADRAVGMSRLLGPTGPEIGYRVLAPEVTLMGRTLAGIEISCHDLAEDLELDGVVGLDIIRQGRLTVDFPAGLMEFRWA